MKRTLFLLGFLLLSSFTVYSQTQCPSDMVCLSPAAAQAAVVAHQTVKAQAEQIKALEQALNDEKDLKNKALLEFATVSGENTALRQNDVSNRAIITAMIPMLRQKIFGVKIF